MAADNRYLQEVGNPLYLLILEALLTGEWRYDENNIKDLIDSGWYKFNKARQVEYDTSIVFEHYLRDKMDILLHLALKNPDVFDQELGVLRYNYRIIAYKTILKMIEGCRNAPDSNNPYDAKTKRYVLLDLLWVKFYQTLKAKLESFPKSIAMEWALVAVELRCREHDDQRNHRLNWQHCCPFATHFREAFFMYSIQKVKELIKIDNVDWFE